MIVGVMVMDPFGAIIGFAGFALGLYIFYRVVKYVVRELRLLRSLRPRGRDKR